MMLGRDIFSRVLVGGQIALKVSLVSIGVALLIGLVLGLIATTGGAAGLAALSASQAAAMESSLRFSRANEQGADRIGMQTMADAGMDPHAAPTMFERMLSASRYSSGNRVPEFLRTHPLSENRISDTRNRARQYPKVVREQSLEFHLMRARIQLLHSDTVGPQGLRYRMGHFLNRLHNGSQLLGRGIKYVAAGCFWDHQQMPVGPRHDVHEHKCLIIFKNTV